MMPFDLAHIAGSFGYALVFLAIGMGFGAALEMTGFGDTRKLAAQFYLRDMTVLKTMFTAIAVAAVLLYLSVAFGLLDMSRVWINPTYLWPGILGGAIMGVGFVIGGFCPGTSVVAASTLKVDGMFFVLGVLFGIYLFGETVSGFEGFFYAPSMGRFTLDQWLGLPVGLTVLLVVAMALFLFWVAELLEQRFGAGRPWSEIALRPRSRWKLAGAAALGASCLLLWGHGQPSAAQRWARMPQAVKGMVADRALFASPAEVVALRQDTSVRVSILDLRSEHDYNLFHVGDSERIDPAALERPARLRALVDSPSTTVTFLVGNGEREPLAAWKRLRAQGVANLYVVEGGINRWLDLYPPPACVARREAAADPDALAYRFAYATGALLPSAWPELRASRNFRIPCGEGARAAAGGEEEGILWPSHPFEKRVKLQLKVAVKGGCG